MATDYGIDLGTEWIRIFSGRNLVLEERSCISFDTHTQELIAAGEDAYNMIGRTPQRITALCPIERGAIANYEMAENMIRAYLGTISNNKLMRARVVVAVHSGITSVQERSIVNSCVSSGVRDVCLIEAPVAAAIGAGIDFSTPHGSLIVDIGAGTTDIATLSLGGISKYESINVAGSDFTDAILKYVRREHNVDIGLHTAERIKRQIGCVVQRPLELTLTAKGIDKFTGQPKTFEINTNEMMVALYDTAMTICTTVQKVIEQTPPEIAADISTDGIVLIGGGASLYGMKEFLEQYTGLSVKTPSEPTYCVGKGAGIAVRDFAFLKNGGYHFTPADAD